MQTRNLGLVALLVGLVALGASNGNVARAADAPRPKVLVIGIDGCRTDALKAAKTPNLDALVREGALVEGTRILSDRFNKSDTSSGPGWSSILTGVWADKHGVLDNKFRVKHFDDYPHFFQRVKGHDPKAVTVSLVNWPPIHEEIVRAADVSQSLTDGKKDYPRYDREVTRAATAILGEQDPTAMFVYFNQVDETGHSRGFDPQVKPYCEAIERVDSHVGQVLQALRDRKTYAEEAWLVLVCTDHGGRGLSHGGSHQYPEVTETWLIASGREFKGQQLAKPTYLVDVVPTALTHLGLKIDPKWKLDGRPLMATAAESTDRP